MNSKEALEIIVEKELEQYPEKDVLVYYQRGDIHLTHGFYAWDGYSHRRTTISELLQDGFEKSDIKELRADASKFLIVEGILGKFEVHHGRRK